MSECSDSARVVPGLVTSSAASGARLRIGIELADLKKIPKVLGVAGGVHKVEAILGALRGGFLNVLVTNEIAGIRLLGLEAS